MKSFDHTFRGRYGSIPPQLFPYIDTNNMASETRVFTEYMNAVAASFLDKNEELEYTSGPDTYRIDVPATPQLFGHDVTMEYIARGTVGAVFRMQIGEKAFAFKVNFHPQMIFDLRGISEYKRARNLINRPYIGATFSWRRRLHSWVLSDYQDADCANSYARAEEKLFYAGITKGLSYGDMHPQNVINGRIIDLCSVCHSAPRLGPAEIDVVKKFVYLMRTNDTAGARALLRWAMLRHPGAIEYMYNRMAPCVLPIPRRFKPFVLMVVECEMRDRD